jgi:hypothetical protein
MRREDEYRQLANSVRRRAAGGKKRTAESAILAGTYVQFADQSEKIDDTGTFDDPILRDRDR